MSQQRMEVIVGVFVAVGILALGYLAIRLGKIELFGNRGYVVYADFASVAGLKEGDPIEIAGVKVGRVESISLDTDGFQARLGLKIDSDVQIQEDAIASVRARGLIGDKFVAISPGGSDRLVKAGGKIRETESPPDLPDLLGKLVAGDLTSGGVKK